MYGLCGVEVGGGQVEFLGGLPPDIHRTIIGNIADPFLAIDMGSESGDPLESYGRHEPCLIYTIN